MTQINRKDSMSSPYYLDDRLTVEEGTRRWEREKGGAAKEISDPGFYTVAVRHIDRGGWVFRFSSLGRYEREALKNLNNLDTIESLAA